MLRYALRRTGAAIGVLATVTVLVFVLFELLDSDAAVVILSRQGAGDPSPEHLATLRAELGLDRPAPVRFAEWLAGFLHGDLGQSLISGRPVADVLFDRVANSAALGLLTLLVLIPLALGLGLAAGTRPGSRTDRIVSAAALTMEAIPSFVHGVLLVVVLALSLRLFPAVSLVPTGTSAWERPEVLVLPVACLVLGLSPHPARMVRAQTTEVMTSEYIRTVRLNGVGGMRLVLRHVAPNAVSASIHPLAGSAVGLVGGIAVVETLFSYPGVSQELLIAISARDYPFVQSAAVLLAAFGIGVYLLADLLALLVSPRARALVGEGRW
ncbi:ABC transporter permease [Nocardia donostiensis]|uniref:ABC transporter permease n=1 Tax=Nocardia donostiensis TaxID=1538463 RepID=A0A1W0B5A0_9NOCA|nr:ABC transporter permease [Nocardia donostiensis]ONM48192.1 ABC transporter permease [Nocardia donostiensis]OQS13817.1 ABC transporter permease [Nocardia donostiensis]OQS17692.1 ABC transporter permease [Nocardia donostiensis]